VNIGEILKTQVTERLKAFGLKATLVAKNIGYELRCADPIPFDMEYTRDLGYCAAKYVLSGGSNAMVSMQAGASCRFRSSRCSTRRPAGRGRGWWTPTRRATTSRAAT
jgi:6-phosphofructokinase